MMEPKEEAKLQVTSKFSAIDPNLSAINLNDCNTEGSLTSNESVNLNSRNSKMPVDGSGSSRNTTDTKTPEWYKLGGSTD